MTKTHRLIGGLLLAAAGTAFAASGRSATVQEKPQQDPEWGIAIHGGAGSIDTVRMSPLERQLRRDALMRSLRAGHRILAAGGSSLDAVQAAIMVLEDDSMFNAGKGAVLNAQGKPSWMRRSWTERLSMQAQWPAFITSRIRSRWRASSWRNRRT